MLPATYDKAFLAEASITKLDKDRGEIGKENKLGEGRGYEPRITEGREYFSARPKWWARDVK